MRTSFFEALGTAFANAGLAASVVFTSFSIIALQLHNLGGKLAYTGDTLVRLDGKLLAPKVAVPDASAASSTAVAAAAVLAEIV